MGQHRSNVGPTLHCQRLTIYQQCDSMPTLGQRCHAIWGTIICTKHKGICQTAYQTLMPQAENAFPVCNSYTDKNINKIKLSSAGSTLGHQ